MASLRGTAAARAGAETITTIGMKAATATSSGSSPGTSTIRSRAAIRTGRGVCQSGTISRAGCELVPRGGGKFMKPPACDSLIGGMALGARELYVAYSQQLLDGDFSLASLQRAHRWAGSASRRGDQPGSECARVERPGSLPWVPFAASSWTSGSSSPTACSQ